MAGKGTKTGNLSVQRALLSQQIADIIRDQILTGGLQPGEHVPQAQWAERVGASRMPVRDAINQLCAEGHLVQDETGSASVVDIDPSDIRDGYELNAVVGRLAARRAASRISDADLAELERIHKEMGRAAKAGDRELASHLNWSFHATINSAARSSRLSAVLRNLASSIPHSAFERLPEWPKQAQKEHAELIAALRDHDGDAAGEIMERHILAGSKPMLDQVEKRLKRPAKKGKK